MRDELCAALVERAAKPHMMFLTGDLGLMAFEPPKKKLRSRFINCGIAEQNMVTVGAALAKEGLEVWIYPKIKSIINRYPIDYWRLAPLPPPIKISMVWLLKASKIVRIHLGIEVENFMTVARKGY